MLVGIESLPGQWIVLLWRISLGEGIFGPMGWIADLGEDLPGRFQYSDWC